MATLTFICLVLVLQGIGLFAQAAILKLLCKWLSVPNITICSALLYLLANFVLGIGLIVLRFSAGPSVPLDLAIVALVLVVGFWLLAKWFRLRPVQAIGVGLVTQIGGMLLSLTLALMFRAIAFEAFKAPTNSMAPTLLGVHVVGTCPRCHQTAYGSPQNPLLDENTPEIHAICGQDYRACQIPRNGPRGSQDRFVISKLHEPKRWDLIVFRYPENPATFYVKRLVGLPGERIVIKDGAVWANGEKLVPPEEFANLNFVVDYSRFGVPDGMPEWVLWGDERRPAQLSEGEYFVLGDNSERAKDSRLWEQGADGHPPYAVPQEYIHGVVTTIYWPPSRWRAFK